MQYFIEIFSRFIYASLYKSGKLCYTVYMSIRTYFQAKRQEKRENAERIKQLQEIGLQFPVFCKVHAVKSPDHQGAIVQSRVGDKLQIVHTPTPDRPFCCTVYSIGLNRVLGFIEDGLAEKLTRAFGQNFYRDGEVEQITGGPPLTYFGCNIRVMDTKYFLEEMTNELH